MLWLSNVVLSNVAVPLFNILAPYKDVFVIVLSATLRVAFSSLFIVPFSISTALIVELFIIVVPLLSITCGVFNIVDNFVSSIVKLLLFSIRVIPEPIRFPFLVLSVSISLSVPLFIIYSLFL